MMVGDVWDEVHPLLLPFPPRKGYASPIFTIIKDPATSPFHSQQSVSRLVTPTTSPLFPSTKIQSNASSLFRREAYSSTPSLTPDSLPRRSEKFSSTHQLAVRSLKSPIIITGIWNHCSTTGEKRFYSTNLATGKVFKKRKGYRTFEDKESKGTEDFAVRKEKFFLRETEYHCSSEEYRRRKEICFKPSSEKSSYDEYFFNKKNRDINSPKVIIHSVGK